MIKILAIMLLATGLYADVTKTTEYNGMFVTYVISEAKDKTVEYSNVTQYNVSTLDGNKFLVLMNKDEVVVMYDLNRVIAFGRLNKASNKNNKASNKNNKDAINILIRLRNMVIRDESITNNATFYIRDELRDAINKLEEAQ